MILADRKSFTNLLPILFDVGYTHYPHGHDAEQIVSHSPTTHFLIVQQVRSVYQLWSGTVQVGFCQLDPNLDISEGREITSTRLACSQVCIFLIFSFKLFYLCVWMFCMNVCMHVICPPGPRKPELVSGSSRT